MWRGFFFLLRFSLKRHIKAILWLDLLLYFLNPAATPPPPPSQNKKKKYFKLANSGPVRAISPAKMLNIVKRQPLLGVWIAPSVLNTMLAITAKMSHRSLHTTRSTFWTGGEGGERVERGCLRRGVTKPECDTTFLESVEGVEWSHSCAWKSSICLIHECAFEFAWLLVQLPLHIGRRRTQGPDTRRRLTPGGSYTPHKCIWHL